MFLSALEQAGQSPCIVSSACFGQLVACPKTREMLPLALGGATNDPRGCTASGSNGPTMGLGPLKGVTSMA